MGLTRKELAAMFGVSVSNIRSWEQKFKEHITTPAPAPHDNDPKEYNDNDIAVFTIIARGREAGRSLKDIGKSLAAELATFTDDQLPAPPEPEIAGSSQLITGDQVQQLRDMLSNVSGQLTATESERDRLIDDLAAERAARIEAEKEAARLAGQLEARQEADQRPAPWYRRMFDRK